ncbi:MAG TPA: DUF1577 domain-containing protein [Turneriella sp.]|nr:DUF1577 domain-containing protein [Turneriella sp.]
MGWFIRRSFFNFNTAKTEISNMEVTLAKPIPGYKEVDPFESANPENSYYGILNLLYYLKAKYVRVHFRYSGYVYIAHCESIAQDEVLLVAHGFQETQERRAVIQFEAYNRYYMARVLVLRTNENGIFIQFPQELLYLQRRKHIRLRFDDLFMRFTILYSPIGHTRLDEKNLESRFPFVMQEVSREDVSLQTMYRMVAAEIENISSDFELVLFSSKSEEELSLVEKIVRDEGKTFYIEDTMRVLSYTSPYENRHLINLSTLYEELAQKEGEAKALKYIEEIRKSDARAFIVSYILSPISLFNERIGYVRVETNPFDKKYINPFQAADLHRLMELFSYAMSKVRIRTSHFNPNSVETRVVNISLSGLLLEFSDAAIFEYLKKNRRIKMLIPVMGEDLEFYGEIVRFNERSGFYYLGVLFFKSKPGDMIRLERFIHENMQFQFL